MTKRSLYLVAYDISHPRRLRLALHVIKHYATGGQKSVFECYLNETEKQRILRDMGNVIDEDEDRLFLLRLDTRCGVDTLGIAIKPADQKFFYVG